MVVLNNRKLYRFLLETLDPVHVGAGGYHIGRVDLPIIRETGTRLPKLPGTGITGALRHNAALFYGKPVCAGQGLQNEEQEQQGQCGESTCPICYTFGSIRGEKSVAGTIHIFDARILFFPVYSTAGPVWVTCPNILLELNMVEDGNVSKITMDTVLVGKGLQQHNYLNLGWLMVKVGNDTQNSEGEAGEQNFFLRSLEILPKPVRERFVVVGDTIFSQIVNSNLEVRTSVSINPETGAARQGALFTYEAIPRATFLWFDVLENDFRENEGTKPWTVTKMAMRENDRWLDNEGNAFPENVIWKSPLDVVKKGLDILEYLGVGGMTTRGFGRVKNLGGGGA